MMRDETISNLTNKLPGINIRWLAVNQAWVVMWHETPLRIFGGWDGWDAMIDYLTDIGR